MSDAEKFELAKAGLRFCPECGQPTKQHPRNVIMVSCLEHGDFMLLWIDGDLVVRWRALRMSPRTDIPEPDIEKITKILDIGARYTRGEITFIEACQLIAFARGKEFPHEPSSEDLMEGHTILDGYAENIKSFRL